jgi:hypothetical protein
MVLIYSYKNNQSIFYYSLVYFGLLKKGFPEKINTIYCFNFFGKVLSSLFTSFIYSHSKMNKENRIY